MNTVILSELQLILNTEQVKSDDQIRIIAELSQMIGNDKYMEMIHKSLNELISNNAKRTEV